MLLCGCSLLPADISERIRHAFCDDALYKLTFHLHLCLSSFLQ